jgi:hypothetical protein
MNQPTEHQQKATREAWKTVAMPEQKSRLAWPRTFTSQEFDRLSRGLIPAAMEDKWFIYLEDQVLYFHRSWTGFCIYQLHLKPAGDGWAATEAWVNRDNEQYKATSDDYDSALLAFLIDNLLLGKRHPFPMPNNLSPQTPPDIYQHHIAGTGYPEKPVPSQDSLPEKPGPPFSKK